MADVGVFSRYKGFNDFQEQAKKNSLANALASAQIQAAQTKIAKTAMGGDLPAVLQIANEYQKARSAGDAQRMADIEVFAKAFDKGVISSGAGAISNPQPATLLTSTEPPAAPPSPSPITDSGKAQAIDSLFGTGYDTGKGDAPVPNFTKTLGSVTTIPGYNEALAIRGATVKGAEKQAEKNVELEMNPIIAKATKVAEGQGGKILDNDAALGNLQSMRDSIADARLLVPTVAMTGPILGRVGALAQDPDYNNLQGALNSITLQAKELYNLGSGQGFTDADRTFLQEIVSGKYARAEQIPMALERLDRALARREAFLAKQNASYGAPAPALVPAPTAPKLKPSDVSASLFNARKAIKKNPANREAVIQRLQAAGIPTEGL